ncbi:hypothetical protein GCM10009118_04750 [Wandonia haliotis]|uniref:Uncharacterized protein n=1 Tax=Wandonia haliotis TaxID=574963 RepID=A0ABN1MLJ7_9FLAO
MSKKEYYQSAENVEKFKMLSELLDSIYLEMKEFSKKKPDEPLNTFKCKNVNRVLTQLQELLNEEPTIGFLDLLDEETLPTNSDAILVIGQYQASMKRYYNKYTDTYRNWNIK